MLALGIGLLAASFAARWRLLLAGLVVTPFALVNVAWSTGILASSYLFGAYVLAAAVGMGAANFAARRNLVGAHPFSPIVVLAAIGLLLLGISVPNAPFGGFYLWFVSWWMPATIFGLLGVVKFISRMAMQSGRS